MCRMHWELIAQQLHAKNRAKLPQPTHCPRCVAADRPAIPADACAHMQPKISERKARAIFRDLYKAFEAGPTRARVAEIDEIDPDRASQYAHWLTESRARHEEKFVRWVLHGPPKSREMSKVTRHKVNAILRKHKVWDQP